MKVLFKRIEMAKLLGVRLITLKVVQRGLDRVARLLVGADDIDMVADGVHRLLEDENLVFFAELSDQHQDFLA